MAKKTAHALLIWLPLIGYILYNMEVERTPLYMDYIIAGYEIAIAIILYAYFTPPNSRVNLVLEETTPHGHMFQLYYGRVRKSWFTWSYHAYIYDSRNNILLTKRLFPNKAEATKWAKAWHR